jgi:hypothetical protein
MRRGSDGPRLTFVVEKPILAFTRHFVVAKPILAAVRAFFAGFEESANKISASVIKVYRHWIPHVGLPAIVAPVVIAIGAPFVFSPR